MLIPVHPRLANHIFQLHSMSTHMQCYATTQHLQTVLAAMTQMWFSITSTVVLRSRGCAVAPIRTFLGSLVGRFAHRWRSWSACSGLLRVGICRKVSLATPLQRHPSLRMGEPCWFRTRRWVSASLFPHSKIVSKPPCWMYLGSWYSEISALLFPHSKMGIRITVAVPCVHGVVCPRYHCVGFGNLMSFLKLGLLKFWRGKNTTILLQWVQRFRAHEL